MLEFWDGFCFKERFLFFLVLLSVCYDVQTSREATTVTAIALFNSLFTSLSFSLHPNVIYPLLLLLPPPPSLPERRHMQSQVNTLICGRNLSHPPTGLFLSHSLHTAYVGHHDSLLYASKAGSLLYLEPSHVPCCIREYLAVGVSRRGTYRPTILCLKLLF